MKASEAKLLTERNCQQELEEILYLIKCNAYSGSYCAWVEGLSKEAELELINLGYTTLRYGDSLETEIRWDYPINKER